MSKTRLNRFALLLFVAMANSALWAQIPNGYYNTAEGKTGDELKIALHNIIKGHHEVSYGGLLDAFAYTDCKPNGKIWDIYSNIEYSLNTGLCGDYAQEGDCWNREHTWPQSWFNDQTTPRCDLFHVYPTDGYVNNRRGSLPYGEVNNPTYTSGNGSKLGKCSTAGYNGTVFEPIDEYKGDIARSYFYMSVRYYSEDDSWSTSSMTNKSVIKDWAMTMLLRWSDEDPVSQKEIDRNNAVYGYQNNRNPFIDHPEYAHIIWEPGWSGTPYAITCASGLSHGSISAPSTAVAGTLVTLTATPNSGYELDTWTVTKTGDASTIITVNSNNTFVMPDYPVTVSATFKVNNTNYHITPGSVSHGSISINPTTAKSGTLINLTATPDNGYSLYAWYVYKADDINTHVTVTTSGNTGTFIMPAYDVTVLASFAQNSGAGYEKVTSAPSDWSGEYILVYENSATQGYVWTGMDAANCYVTKTITNNTIADDDFVTIVIAPMSGGYSIQVHGGTNNGKYIYGQLGQNAISFGANPSLNTISIESNSVKIVSNTSVLRYNSSATVFRYYKSNTYTDQKPIQLYKKTSGTAYVPTHTIHFYPNGSSQSSYTQTVNEFEPTALMANTFTRQGYAFDSWNTATDGSGTTYYDGALVTLLSDLDLYAQWMPTYTISCASVDHGSISASCPEAVEGDVVTLTATPDANYDLEYWTVTAANDEPVEVEGNLFVMPASNVTVSAVFTYVEPSYTQKYYLVTDASQLVEGRTYLVVCKSKSKALGPQSDYIRESKSVTISDNNSITNINGASELVLGCSDDSWTLWDGTGYLCAGSSINNHLLTQTELNDEGRWTITINENNDASIVAQGNYTHKNLKYGSGGNYFGCFQSGATAVSLFVRSEEYDHTENTTLACLNSFDKTTVRTGVTLTATTVLGIDQCNNAGQIILEEGAQLYHNTAGLNATVKKTITGYTDNGGWYTLATPFSSYNPAGVLTTDNYDLYYYDEDGNNEGREWRNYKANAFNLAAGQGYLYAHNPSLTLRMAGTLNSGNYSSTVNLDYANSDANLKGFNLLGNPTAHDIEFSKTASVSDGYYYLNNSEAWVYTTTTTIPVGRGFLVKANASGQSVTLNLQSKGERAEKGQYLCLAIGEERAYVKLNEGVSMPSLDLNGRHVGLYLTRDGQSYAMLVRDGVDALDLCFEARRPGEHTLAIDTQGLDLDYLHLIDNLTGADIDLLSLCEAGRGLPQCEAGSGLPQCEAGSGLPLCKGGGGGFNNLTPAYTFHASLTDYPSRFRLVFTPTAAEPAEEATTFAYLSHGQIIITGLDAITGPATLQIIDAQGRVLSCKDAMHRVSTAGMTSGVYILRLITAENVKMQKIVM